MAGVPVDLKLTFYPDHPIGAGHFHPRRDLALRYADGSAPDPAVHPIDNAQPKRWSELTTE